MNATDENNWGSVTEIEKSERGTGAVNMRLYLLWQKDTASQTEDEHRITKWSKQSWARVRGKNS